MSLPKNLYMSYQAILELVKDKTVENFNQRLEELLNAAQPTNDFERGEQSFARRLYYSNPDAFTKYVNTPKNRAGAVILWTESKRIVRRFGLYKTVHLSWNKDTQRYVVNHYVPRETAESKTVSWADES